MNDQNAKVLSRRLERDKRLNKWIGNIFIRDIIINQTYIYLKNPKPSFKVKKLAKFIKKNLSIYYTKIVSKRDFLEFDQIVLRANTHRIIKDGIYKCKFIPETSKTLNIEYQSTLKFDLLNFFNPNILLFKYICVQDDLNINTEIQRTLDNLDDYSVKEQDKFKIYIRVREVYQSFKWATEFLEKNKINSITTLCFYSPIPQGFTIAANQKKIKSIEYQHGSLSKDHVCYYKEVFEKESKNIYPTNYILWNEFSAFTLQPICNYYGFYSQIEKQNVQIKVKSTNDNILFTFGSLDLYQFDFTIDLILKIAIKYKILIREHPRHRLSKTQKEQLISPNIIFSESQKRTVLEDLSISWLHLTRISGSFFEALEIGIPTLLIDKRALEYFSYYSNNNLVYYNDSQDSESILQAINEIAGKRKRYT